MTKGEGDKTFQWALKANGESAQRRVLLPLQVVDPNSLTEAKNRKLFDELVNKWWGSSIKPPENSEVNNDEQYYEEHQDNVESTRAIPDI